MNTDDSPSNLSRMEATRWSDVHAPNDPQLPAEVRQARLERFFQLYSTAIRKYLRALSAAHPQGAEVAEDCFQQFAVKFLEGRFGQCSPNGRFRDYLKAALRNLVMTRFREREVRALDTDLILTLAEVDESDHLLEEIFRERFIKRGMQRLAEEDLRRETHLHLVLKLRVRYPDSNYQDLAEVVSDKLARQVDAGWVRKRVSQARDLLRQYVRDEVAHSLGTPGEVAVDEELAALGLLQFVSKRKP